ncbi:nucleotidyl transferase AbiEii/AbiGii toxin family protein [Schleiferilactobacillus perolens]|uniref:Abortive infection protein AbiGII n=1 Tax=Schleiferilactobacillus perolens DSM 12744 TaxID=1423792 RepID=A0A0R1MSH0_9LACO|nr:nucleotidyl transferase AbiEii/AbiGii toxin family protein [Schleiferilactobacillus perolens]KRL11088.1 hypothetical protein FD09_GL000815 [Schleiferilactobacillus perolens DSM 12744]
MSHDPLIQRINAAARKSKVPPTQFQRMYFLEQFLILVAASPYRDNFIFKGGMEIQSLIGVANRATQDIDSTLAGQSLSKANIQKMMQEIFTDKGSVSSVTFNVSSIKAKMADHNYPGFLVSLDATLKGSNARAKIKIDLSTGDSIHPHTIELIHHHLLDPQQTTKLQAYPLEQIMADKLEAFLYFGPINSRAKDFYDLYMFATLLKNDWQVQTLQTAFTKTVSTKGRVPTTVVQDPLTALTVIQSSPVIHDNWLRYQKDHPYAQDISLDNVMRTIETLFNRIK